MRMVRLCLLLAAAFPAFAAVLEPISLDETVRRADSIVVGTVTARQSRWADASKRWMWTDFTFAVEETVFGEAASEPIVLTYWGGTIGEETHTLSGIRIPAVGERLVVMLRPERERATAFAPTVGANKGLFVVARDSGVVLDGDMQRIERAATGRLVRDQGTGGAAVDLATFTNWLRNEAAAIRHMPPETPPAIDWSDPRVMKTFASKPDLPDFARLPRASSVATAQLPARPLPNPILPAATLAPGAAPEAPAKQRPEPDYVRSVSASFPLIVNQFPADFGGWSPHDQYVMAAWNFYADVFRVYLTPTGTYSWPDGVFDLAGWPSDADMQRVYGFSWSGSGALGVAISRTSGSTIIESDVALNPAYAWTLDDEWVQDGSFAYSFRHTMSHELGHMHGLGHQFDFLSVMNYLPGRVRYWALPFMDDAAGIRGGYPGRVVGVHDLGVYLFRNFGHQSAWFASFPPVVRPGEREALYITNFHLENVGTTTIDAPTVYWYLTQERNFSAYHELGSITYGALAPGQYYDNITQYMTVPANVPAGWYWLAAYIPNDNGASHGAYPWSNDFAFSHEMIEVFRCPEITAAVLQPACSGGTVQLNAPYFENASYSWTGPNGFTASGQSPVISPVTGAHNGTYTVTMTYRGCSVSATTTLDVNPPPTSVSALAVTPSRVDVDWIGSSCATRYDVYRNAGSGYVKIGSSTTNEFRDLTAAANTSYLYAVRSIDAAGNVSPLTPPQLATTVIFTDPAITAGKTIIRAAHLRELRTAVASVRALAGLPPATLTDPAITPGVTKCRAVHLTELRSALAAARSALGLPAASYAPIAAGTGVSMWHVIELRIAVW